ncbi:hypothetical protein V5O39_05550 [Pseudomonas parakoreensis]
MTIAVQGKQLHDKILKKSRHDDLGLKLANVIPLKALLDADDLAIYQADEKTGSIAKLPMAEGIPSDSNYLNESLREGNDMFDRLLISRRSWRREFSRYRLPERPFRRSRVWPL